MAKEAQKTLIEAAPTAQGPVECLGITFENDEARRQYFLDKLREKLQDPEFRKIEGFPNGEDEDILALSDPPYYTACPNPFVGDFVEFVGTTYDPKSDDYHREPMAVDVSEGKTDALYTAHSYHTKVPHKAIIRAILHYTSPGDLVLDGFAGSGMVGVAAQICGNPEMKFRRAVDSEWMQDSDVLPSWGARRAILVDLAPAATFIASNYNLPLDVRAFDQCATQMLNELRSDIGWMFATRNKLQGVINFTVWSEVFTCPHCGSEVVFVNEAFNVETKKIRRQFPCPDCQAALTKDNLERSFETFVDPATTKPWQRIRLRPVRVNYTVGKDRQEQDADDADQALLSRIADMPLPATVPTDPFPLEAMYHGSRLAPKGFTHVHHLFLPRQLQWYGLLWSKALAVGDSRLRNMLLYMIDQSVWGASVLNRYSPTHYSQVNRQLSGVYYVPSQIAECSPWYMFDGKLRRLIKAFDRQYAEYGNAIISTSSATRLALPEESVDYIFTDPPFGANIPYADLNFLVESWHGVHTNPTTEAIVDRMKQKGLPEYQRLMQRCFEEYYRVLKPGRWMTMVFHNSHNSVWNCIQEAMAVAGFVVADVRTLDKQQGSYRQVTSTAVKQDLVVSAYKPHTGLERKFELTAGNEEGVWEFVSMHLRQLPVFVAKNGKAETIAERQNHLLFDRMVAFHVQRGVAVPMSAAEFYAGLNHRFPERDSMYFVPEQATEYDKRRMSVQEVVQLELFVNNENTAIQWLRRLLEKKPQPMQDIRPQFMKELAGWEKYEKHLELQDLLNQNFLSYDGHGDVPSQVHSYLSTNFHELRNLEKDNPKLIAKAKNRWYVPDPRKEADLEKIRNRALMKEFEAYRESKGKLKVVRIESLRAGFKECWQTGDYERIVDMAKRVKDDIIQADPALLMYYDNALMRTEE